MSWKTKVKEFFALNTNEDIMENSLEEIQKDEKLVQEAALEDGRMIMAESFEIGEPVMVMNEDGEPVLLEDGEYMIMVEQAAYKLEIREGAIVEIELEEPEAEEEEIVEEEAIVEAEAEMPIENPVEETEKIQEQYGFEKLIEEMKEKMEDHGKRLEEMEAKLNDYVAQEEKMESHIENLESQIQELSKQPATQGITHTPEESKGIDKFQKAIMELRALRKK